MNNKIDKVYKNVYPRLYIFIVSFSILGLSSLYLLFTTDIDSAIYVFEMCSLLMSPIWLYNWFFVANKVYITRDFMKIMYPIRFKKPKIIYWRDILSFEISSSKDPFKRTSTIKLKNGKIVDLTMELLDKKILNSAKLHWENYQK